MYITHFIIWLLQVKCLWYSFPSFITVRTVAEMFTASLEKGWLPHKEPLNHKWYTCIWQGMAINASLSSALLKTTFRRCNCFISLSIFPQSFFLHWGGSHDEIYCHKNMSDNFCTFHLKQLAYISTGSEVTHFFYSLFEHSVTCLQTCTSQLLGSNGAISMWLQTGKHHEKRPVTSYIILYILRRHSSKHYLWSAFSR
jgi:hypothetical protein